MKIKDVKKRIDELGFSIPKTVFFEEKREGIRVASKALMSVKVKGKRGILAYKTDITQGFILTFGKYSSKRVLLNDKQLFQAAQSLSFEIEAEDGEYIAFYKSFPVCVVKIEDRKAYPKISHGFKRKIKNFLK